MKPLCLLLIGVGLVTLLTGCEVISLNPLLDPANAKEDKHLSGRWRSISQDKPVYVQFANAKGHELKISLQGEDVDAELRNSGLRGYATQIGGYRYISVGPSE